MFFALAAMLVGCAGFALCGCKTEPVAASSPATTPTTPAVAAPEPATTAAADADDLLARLDQATRPAVSPLPPAPKPAHVQVQWDDPVKHTPARPAPPAPAPVVKIESAPAVSPGPDRPLTTVELVQRLADQLKRDAAAGKAGLRPHLALAAMSLIDPAREITEKDLPGLSPDDRKLVLAYQQAFTTLGRSLGEAADADRQQVRLAAEELYEQLAMKRPMRIRNAHLCTKVNGYGVYTPFASNTFLAGREHPVIVYAELDDFVAKAGGDGQFTVNLTQEIVLYNESDGLAVWRVKPTEILDQSRNRRRDFFVVQIVQLPARLTVGKYMLSLSVTDQHGLTMDEAKIPVQIVADTSATP
jgi:hypothetical protein